MTIEQHLRNAVRRETPVLVESERCPQLESRLEHGPQHHMIRPCPQCMCVLIVYVSCIHFCMSCMCCGCVGNAHPWGHTSRSNILTINAHIQVITIERNTAYRFCWSSLRKTKVNVVGGRRCHLSHSGLLGSRQCQRFSDFLRCRMLTQVVSYPLVGFFTYPTLFVVLSLAIDGHGIRRSVLLTARPSRRLGPRQAS